MNAREVCYFCKKDLGSSYTYHWGNKAHIKCEAANELPSLKRRVEAAGFTIMSKEDMEAVRDKALEEAAAMCEKPRRFHDGSENTMPSGMAYAAAIRSLKSEARE